MPKHPLTARVLRRPKKSRRTDPPVARQWKLLELLSADPNGATVKQLAKISGVCSKSIRRDLILLQRMGFALKETVERHGRKRWRVLHPFERLRTKWQRYHSIRDSLAVLIGQAQAIGDEGLVADLEAIRKVVARKGR